MGSVSPDALARLASMKRPEQPAGTSGWTYDARAMLKANDADLEALGITTGKEKPHAGGGRLWELTGCPYSHDHDDSAFRIQYPDGGVHVGCHHARCQGKTIKSVPQLFSRTVAVNGTPPPVSGGIMFGGRPIGGIQGTSDGTDAGPEPDAPHHAEPEAPAPMWPAGILPEDIDHYVTAQARAIGVPEEAVAVPLLVFAGGTAGNSVELELKPGFWVLPTLWAAMIADPGKKKTPALKAAQWPLNILQTRMYEEWQEAMSEFEAHMQAWEAKPKGERGEKPQPPRLDHLYTTDITMETMVGYLEHGRGLTVIRDELSGFIGAMDKYRGKGDDRQQYLSLWAGSDIKTDRKGGGTVYARHPVGSVYGGVQPDYASALHSEDGRRDGMVERFLLFRPDVRRTGWTDDAVERALVEPVVNTFAALRSVRKRTMLDVAQGIERATVKLHPDAKRRWVAWFDANDAATEQERGLRQGFYSKLDSQLARIALILHCLHNADDPRVMLSDATMCAAIAAVEFFRAHLDRVVPLLTAAGEPVGLEARILRYLRTSDLHEGDGWVRRGVLLHKLNCPADELTAALDSLQQRGVVEARTVDSATKPSEQWRIHVTPHSKNSNISTFSGPNGSSRGDSSNTSNSSNGQYDDSGLEPTGTDGARHGEVKI